MGNYTGLIIVLVLILIIVMAIYIGVATLKRKARQVSRELFGTSDLRQGAEMMREELASTPKSVSAMTKLLLPKIVQDFPDFEYDEMKERADNILVDYLRAIGTGGKEMPKDGSTELKEELADYIAMLEEAGQREHFEQIHIHRTEISQYRKSEGRCIITFQSALECFHNVTDREGNLQRGAKDTKYQTKYNTDLIYIQDRELVEDQRTQALGINCPNCGAPLSALGAKVCEYCGSPVVEINIHAWFFCNVEEVKRM